MVIFCCELQSIKYDPSILWSLNSKHLIFEDTVYNGVQFFEKNQEWKKETVVYTVVERVELIELYYENNRCAKRAAVITKGKKFRNGSGLTVFEDI